MSKIVGVCYECDKEFPFQWGWKASNKDNTLLVKLEALSGELYDIDIRCPHCGFVEEAQEDKDED